MCPLQLSIEYDHSSALYGHFKRRVKFEQQHSSALSVVTSVYIASHVAVSQAITMEEGDRPPWCLAAVRQKERPW